MKTIAADLIKAQGTSHTANHIRKYTGSQETINPKRPRPVNEQKTKTRRTRILKDNSILKIQRRLRPKMLRPTSKSCWSWVKRSNTILRRVLSHQMVSK